MSARRVASIASALLVAAIAALASYTHMRGLALRYGQDALIATLLPISVDGMMVVATVALGDGRRYRWSAWLAFWTGVAASVVANVLAAQPSTIARCISAWPAVAFLLVVEVITRGGRLRALHAAALDIAQRSAESRDPVGPGFPVDSAADVPERATSDTTSDTPAKRPGRPKSAAAKVARAHARNPDASHAEIARRAGVSVSSVARHRPAKRDATEPVNGSPVPDLAEVPR